MITQGLSSILNWEEYDIEISGTARNGEEALDCIFSRGTDILVTDIRMPEMTGLELIKTLRDKGCKIPVIILSGYDDFEYVRQAAIYGIENYLLKPVDTEDFKKTIINIVGKLKKADSYRSVFEEGIEILQNNLLLHGIFGTISQKQFALKLKPFDLPPFLAPFRLAALFPLKDKKGFQEKIASFHWNNLLQPFLSPLSTKVVLSPRGRNLIFFMDKTDKIKLSDLAAGLEIIRKEVAHHLEIPCSLYCGKEVDQFHELPSSHESVEKLENDDIAKDLELCHLWDHVEIYTAKADHPLIQKVLIYMHDHLGEGFSLKTLAYEFNVNQAYLGQLFRKETGVQFNAYLNSLRLQRAKMLLRDTLYKIEEVTDLVGFSDTHYFHRIFKKEVGLTPSEYRQLK